MVGQQTSLPKDQEEGPQGINKEQLYPPCENACWQCRQEQSISENTSTISQHLLPALTCNSPGKEVLQTANRPKRARSQDDETTLFSAATPQKRLRASPPPPSPIESTTGENAVTANSGKEITPIEYWRREFCWPKEYFEADSFDFEADNINRVLARMESSASSKPTHITPSDEKPREVKSTPYLSQKYEVLLRTKDSFMRESELDITDTSKTLCRTLLEAEQKVPEDSLFQDHLFEGLCKMIQGRNEARVVRDILPLIVPSAECLALRGAKHLKPLCESINEGWNSSIPLTKPRPQPDYAVGFMDTSFTRDQRQKMQPWIIGSLDASFFLATCYMYFPFLSCEVKSGATGLDVADRQNAHSMTLAVRGIVELFRLVKREKELHREILAFSISHDHESVRIYGHYPVIDGNLTSYYRHEIHESNFTIFGGKEKWTAYKFTKNIYDIWMPTHFDRIRAAIDELPTNVNFEVSELTGSGLSQGLQSRHLSDQSSHDSASMLPEADSSKSSRTGSPHFTPETSLSQGVKRVEGGPFKKPRKRGRED